MENEKIKEEDKEKSALPSEKPQEEKSFHKKIKVSVEEFNALKEKAAKADECIEKMLRLQADYENRRKRQERQNAEFVKFANEGLIAGLLNVMDDFERAIDSSRNSGDINVLIKGVEMIKKHLEGTLEDFGLKKIDPSGQPFDPEKQEAVAHIENDRLAENTVIEVLRKGYELNGKVLRPAVVKVSKKTVEDTDLEGQGPEEKGPADEACEC